MNKIFYILGILCLTTVVACEKHEITLDKEYLDLSTKAQLRLVYAMPVISNDASIVTRLKYNGQLVSDVNTSVGNFWPNSAARYHSLPIGTNTIEMFRGNNRDQLAYSGSVTLDKGRYTAFVHHANKPPTLIKEVEQFPKMDPWKDTVTWINFVHHIYKIDGETPVEKLMIKGRRGAGTVADPYVYIDIASVNFGESSGWVPYRLKPALSGSESSLVFCLYYADGTPYKRFTSATSGLIDWVGTGYTLTKDRFFYFHMNGIEGDAFNNFGVRFSTFNAI